MRGKRLVALAIAAVAAVVAGCGTAQVFTASPTAAPTFVSKTYSEGSPRYCQLLPDGRWVTNVLRSNTACVPDPSYATGDEQADGATAIPRCFKCKLSDWKRAERRAAKDAAADAITTVTTTPTSSDWPYQVRSNFITYCTRDAAMTKAECGCISDRLDREIPVADLGDDAVDVPRVQTAEQACASVTSK